MSNVATLDTNGVIVTPDEKRVRVKVVLANNYVQALRGQNVGEVIDLTGVLSPGYVPGARWGNKGPTRGYILNGLQGYAAQLIPGADAYHWLLQIFSAVGAELAAGAYPAALLGMQDFYVEFSGRDFD